jgi:catechol 2,3-dioxygenase-like lactoylglutathione lyase family enzyme
MSRLQLALRVADLDAAVDFYSRLLAAEPAKRRPGYANFSVAEPPMKLVLIEGDEAGAETRLDHLGVEVGSTEEVAEATDRLTSAGLLTTVQEATTCCYATQDKVWVTGPGQEFWEYYVVTGDARADLEGETDRALADHRGDGTCCVPADAEAEAADRREAACC